MSKYSDEVNSIGCFAVIALCIFCLFLVCTREYPKSERVEVTELKLQVMELESQVEQLEAEIHKLQEQKEKLDYGLDRD
jgi:cell division protein FtsB